MPFYQSFSSATYKERRKELIKLIDQHHQHDGVIILFANFEAEGLAFRQESSFNYFTGVIEPATVLIIDCKTGEDSLLVPNVYPERSKWVSGGVDPSVQKAQELGFNTIDLLGNPCIGYQCRPFFTANEYGFLIDHIKQWIAAGRKIFTPNPMQTHGYVEQRFILMRLAMILNNLLPNVIDISPLIATLRRKKSKQEIAQLFNAIKITQEAQLSATYLLKPGKIEYEVQAGIDFTFIDNGATQAFPSIVASGKNSTVLHYTENNKKIEKKELVVIDIGAQYNYYCADITRTYPVQGTFSKRQQEIYSLVLECQQHIAQLAKPGMWLSNKNEPTKSLNHLARTFFDQKGYGNYFLHGIGHFLGMDVHDVGDYMQPLEPGDVITIEPGLYLQQEGIGVRIEDDYWIIEEGSMCLSEDIPKTVNEITELMENREQKE